MAKVDARTVASLLAAIGCTRRPVADHLARHFGIGPDATALAGSDGVVVTDDHVTIRTEPGDRRPADPALLATAASEASGVVLDQGDVEEAGRLALLGAAPGPLRSTIAAALRTQPPAVAGHVLRAWGRAGLLADDDPHHRWLRTACDDIAGAAPTETLASYLELRQHFEERGDREAEVSVGLAAAIAARRADDLGAVLALVGRADQLTAEGWPEAAGPGVLARALILQLGGQPAEAIEELRAFPRARMEGDWAAQVEMVRGTNLLLLDRADEAIACLERATCLGGPWACAVALELLAIARWHAHDRVGAIADLQASEAQSVAIGSPGSAALASAHRAVLLALVGDPDVRPAMAAARSYGPTPEAEQLLELAAAVDLVDRGSLGPVRTAAEALPVPVRATRAAAWTVALKAALDAFGRDDDRAAVAALGEQHPSLRIALEEGSGAADALASDRLLPCTAGRLLPASWCEPAPAVVEIELLGGSVIRRDGRPVAHADWERSRVRELCLHLAWHRDRSRRQVASTLWPDLTDAAALRNLRVTLSYLGKVIEPDRPSGVASSLIEDRNDRLRFVDDARLRIDVRRAWTEADAVCAAAALGDEAGAVGAARRLLRVPSGTMLGGSLDAPWLEAAQAQLSAMLLAAASSGAPLLLAAGDPVLAAALAELGLEHDPWAERLHQVVVRSHLARDDLDAARRAMRRCHGALDDLGVEPERATHELSALLGHR